jgi:hypothetical protein
MMQSARYLDLQNSHRFHATQFSLHTEQFPPQKNQNINNLNPLPPCCRASQILHPFAVIAIHQKILPPLRVKPIDDTPLQF